MKKNKAVKAETVVVDAVVTENPAPSQTPAVE